MSALSNYLKNVLINHIFRNTDFTRLANIYVALFTATPNDAGGGTELSGVAMPVRRLRPEPHRPRTRPAAAPRPMPAW